MEKDPAPEETWRDRVFKRPTRREVLTLLILWALLYGLFLWAANSDPPPKKPAEIILRDDGTA